MTIKEFLISRIQLYFLLVTLIFAVSMIIGMIFTPGQELYYYQLIGTFFLAALCVLSTFITYSRKEPTVRQVVLRNIIRLILIEGIVLTQIQPPEQENQVLFRILLAAAVLIVYLLASLMMWLRRVRQSGMMTEQLRILQERGSGDRFRCALRFWASAAAYFTGTQCSSLIFCTFFTRRTYFSAVSGSVFMNVLTISIAIMPPMIFAPRHSTFASLC